MTAVGPAQPRKHLIITVVALCCVVGITLVLRTGLQEAKKPVTTENTLVGKPANDFSIVPIANTTETAPLSLANFKGKPLIINFWASWCESCRSEALEMQKFWQAHEKDGVVVLGIAVHDTPANSRGFAEKYGKTYVLGLDETGMAAINYGVTGVPETIFIDAQGVIRHKETGPMDVAMLESTLQLITRM